MATYVTKKMIVDRMMDYPTMTISEFMATQQFNISRNREIVTTTLYGEVERQRAKNKPFYEDDKYKDILPIIKKMQKNGKYPISAYKKEIFRQTRKNIPASLLGRILRKMGVTPEKTTIYVPKEINIF